MKLWITGLFMLVTSLVVHGQNRGGPQFQTITVNPGRICGDIYAAFIGYKAQGQMTQPGFENRPQCNLGQGIQAFQLLYGDFGGTGLVMFGKNDEVIASRSWLSEGRQSALSGAELARSIEGNKFEKIILEAFNNKRGLKITIELVGGSISNVEMF